MSGKIHWKGFNYKFSFSNKLQWIYSSYPLLLDRALVGCVFQGPRPFHPSCQIYWHKSVHSISFLIFLVSVWLLWWHFCHGRCCNLCLLSLARGLSILLILKNQLLKSLIFLGCFSAFYIIVEKITADRQSQPCFS